MQVMFVRHGDALNSTGAYHGSSETALTALGIAQARARRADWEAFAPDVVLVSAARRALETLGELGSEGTVDEDLREIDFGDWEGLSFAEISRRDPGKVEEWSRLAPDFRFPGGESVAEFEARIRSLAARILAMEGRVERLGVVTHGGIIRYLLAELLRLPFDRVWIFDLPPASIARIAIERGYARILEVKP